MTSIRINWPIASGCFLIGIAAVCFFVIWSKKEAGADREPFMAAHPEAGGQSSTSSARRNRPGDIRERALRRSPSSNRANLSTRRLEDLKLAEDFGAIYDELAALAEAQQLANVKDVLAEWCRAGSLELAQWSLTLSRESDPELNLSLNADALSNPSEIIRDIAASELESVSGIHFADSARARLWLVSQRRR